jgi:hypothetical protein
MLDILRDPSPFPSPSPATVCPDAPTVGQGPPTLTALIAKPNCSAVGWASAHQIASRLRTTNPKLRRQAPFQPERPSTSPAASARITFCIVLSCPEACEDLQSTMRRVVRSLGYPRTGYPLHAPMQAAARPSSVVSSALIERHRAHRRRFGACRVRHCALPRPSSSEQPAHNADTGQPTGSALRVLR